jgi:SAM-dependent methyltransferase
LCGFVYVNPQPLQEELDRIYDQLSEGCRKLHLILTRDQIDGYDRTLEVLETHSPGRRLLDVGCAAGFFVERACQRGWQATGIEPSDWAAEAARQRSFMHVITGKLEDSNYAASSFDCITALQVLEHLPKPAELVREIHRLLVPGGVFYADVPNFRSLTISLGVDDFELNRPPGHLNYFTPNSVKRLLEKAGFTGVSTWTGGGIKYENLWGRRTDRGEWGRMRAEIDHIPVPDNVSSSAPATAPPGHRPLWRAVVSPVVDLLIYRVLKAGMGLMVIGYKNDKP